jgi:hypothetical protein
MIQSAVQILGQALSVFFFFFLVTFFARFFFLGGFNAAWMSAIFFLCYCLVAAGGVFLAFFAGFFRAACFDTAWMTAIFAAGFGFHAAAHSKSAAGAERESECHGKNGQ